MKRLKNLSILGTVAIGLSSCGVINKLQKPLNSSEFDPLDRPGFGRNKKAPLVSASDPSVAPTNEYGFKNGDMIEVAIPNTALFKRVPQPGDRYIRVLKKGESLRVVGVQGDFLKVVTEKGDSGYVSSVMVISQGYSSGLQPFDPVADGQAPLVPDVAPEPEIKGIGAPDPSPIVPPVPVPSITDPVPVDPPVDPTPAPEKPKKGGAAPLVPADPDPASGGNGVAPEPEDPGLGN